MENFKMTPEQKEHSDLMIKIFSALMKKKYEEGAKEHKTKLWEVPGIIDLAIEEVLDQAHYLLNLKGQIREVDDVFMETMNTTNNDVQVAVQLVYDKFKILLSKSK